MKINIHLKNTSHLTNKNKNYIHLISCVDTPQYKIYSKSNQILDTGEADLKSEQNKLKLDTVTYIKRMWTSKN
jgi:hypothetical protein